MQEEEQREREVKAIEAERYAKEMELAAREAQQEKQRRHEAYLRFSPPPILHLLYWLNHQPRHMYVHPPAGMLQVLPLFRLLHICEIGMLQ